MGWENVWMLNQVSVGCEAVAYAKSSWAKTKPGTAIEPVMVTSPRKASSGVGEVMASGAESCAAIRSTMEGRRKRIFNSRTNKYNKKRNGGQIISGSPISFSGKMKYGKLRQTYTQEIFYGKISL